MIKFLCILTLIPIGLFGGCGSRDQPKGSGKANAAASQKITGKQAKAMMDEGKPYTLLDVRTMEEFNGGRIRDAMLIPVDELASRAEKELPEKSAVILLYCRSGARSARAAKILTDMGYTNIYDFGGIINWPYETAAD